MYVETDDELNETKWHAKYSKFKNASCPQYIIYEQNQYFTLIHKHP
jgi:hypothetical protein